VQRTQALQAGQALATLLALGVAVFALVVEQLTAKLTAELQSELTAETEAAKRAAEDADRAKSRFLAAASHDMRQPLHALALYISALERRVEGSQAREILANMDGAVRAMTRLFTALLDMARLEAGVLKPEPVDFSICDLLHEVAEHSLDLRGQREVRVTVAPTALRVRADPDLLEIVLRNLASNAVKHSKGGRVLLGCRRVADAVRIEVRDDGEGIPPDELQQIFAEFVRGERAGATEGVGLGLAIVQRLTKLLGHPLSVRSEVGRGSVFTVTVPRAAAAPQRKPALQAEAPMALHGARILVADDEPLALDAMRRALRDAGAEVGTAASAGEAEAIAGEGWALHILDLNLGDEDGLELIERIEAGRGARLRALIVTGTTTPEALGRLRSSGRPWLTKPLSADQLVLAASRLLAEPSATSAS
jgi:signal transduction histidine kinase/CheY-like chemotaxis protein